MSSVALHRVADITGVLIAGVWIDCKAGTFEAHEDGVFGELDVNNLPAGMKTQVRSFVVVDKDGREISGPLASIQAVRC